MIYLASPYTAPSDTLWPESLQNIRYLQALHASAILTSRGRATLSPIVLGHTLALAMKESGLPEPGYDWWIMWSRELLATCDVLCVLCLEGWDTSRGVRDEIQWAKDGEIPIIYIDIHGDQVEQEEE